MLIQCPECGKEISDKAGSCPNCGCPIEKQYGVQNKIQPPTVESLHSIKNILIGVIVLCFIVSGVFFYKAYEVKNKYHHSDNYSSLDKYVYVGGDAYNYIINGTYFAGYSIIASSLLLSGMILVGNSIKITMKIKEYE